jgi:hypothetical protein
MCFLLVLWIIVKLKNSYKFDRIVKEITEEKNIDEPKTDEVIQKIGLAEQTLKEKASREKEEAKKYIKDSQTIGEYLVDRGVAKTDQEKEV